MPQRLYSHHQVIEKGDEQSLLKGIERADKVLHQILADTRFGPTIFASVDPRYHRPFARDTIISDDLLSETDSLIEEKADRAAIHLWHFQTKSGKIPHEIEMFDENNSLYKKGFYDVVEIDGLKLMINNDSVDSTPLLLIRTAEIYGDNVPEDLLPKIKRALKWVKKNMDKNNGWLCYNYTEKGLTNQGWMDSIHGVVNERGKLPVGPIALVEAQALAWKTFKLWSSYFKDEDPNFATELEMRAIDLKKRFNKIFYMKDKKFFAHALDGKQRQIKSISINVGFCLWASYKGESIVFYKYLPEVVGKLTAGTFFNSEGGIKLFEDGQKTFDDEAYHNGPDVYWPFASYLVGKGLIRMGFRDQGLMVLQATNYGLDNPYHNGNFTEQYFNRKGVFSKFKISNEESCKNQAWSVAGYRYASEMLLKESYSSKRSDIANRPQRNYQTV